MEKFAVDLDKVLDDFEFNEDHSVDVNNADAGYSRDFEEHTYLKNKNLECKISPATTSHFNVGDNNYMLAAENASSCDTKTVLANKYIDVNDSFKTNVQQLETNSKINFQDANIYPNFEQFENNFSTLSNINSTASLNYNLRSDEKYEDVGFSTESLKTSLFKRSEIPSKSTSADTVIKPLPQTSKKHSVSNVFNSLHEYINTDVGIPDLSLYTEKINSYETAFEEYEDAVDSVESADVENTERSDQKNDLTEIIDTVTEISIGVIETENVPESNSENSTNLIDITPVTENEAIGGLGDNILVSETITEEINSKTDLSKQLDDCGHSNLVVLKNDFTNVESSIKDVNIKQAEKWDDSELVAENFYKDTNGQIDKNVFINSVCDKYEKNYKNKNTDSVSSVLDSEINEIVSKTNEVESDKKVNVENDDTEYGERRNSEDKSEQGKGDSNNIEINFLTNEKTENLSGLRTAVGFSNIELAEISDADLENYLKELEEDENADDSLNLSENRSEVANSVQINSVENKITEEDNPIEKDNLKEISDEIEKTVLEYDNKYIVDEFSDSSEEIHIPDTEVVIKEKMLIDPETSVFLVNEIDIAEKCDKNETNIDKIVNYSCNNNACNLTNIKINSIDNNKLDGVSQINESENNRDSSDVETKEDEFTSETSDRCANVVENIIKNDINLSSSTTIEKDEVGDNVCSTEQNAVLNGLVQSTVVQNDNEIPNCDNSQNGNEENKLKEVLSPNGNSSCVVDKDDDESKIVEDISQKEVRRPSLNRPNSLDLASKITLDENVTVAPPGETPMVRPDLSSEDTSAVMTEVLNEGIDKTATNSDFSPSTSEVSSVETNEQLNIDEQSLTAYDNHNTLGKRPPYWIPDSETNFCMQCSYKFNMLRRRHHCRACGMLLCSKCCNSKAKLEYLGFAESRVCNQCYETLNKDVNSNNQQIQQQQQADNTSSDSATNSPSHSNMQASNQPNPNNPMEYCSTVPPLQQIENRMPSTPPSVLVPVGVLKRHGSTKSRTEKTVMFSDGIRPGCDLTELDNGWDNSRPIRRHNKRVSTPPGPSTSKVNRNLPMIDQKTLCYIPSEENCLPPTINLFKSDVTYTECSNSESVVEMLRNECLAFAIQRNFSVHLKIVNLDCCVNKQVWCFSTKGLSSVGQDEIIILLEVLENEIKVPKDVFLHLNNIYNDAAKGNTITEMGFSIQNSPNFLGSKNHAGFLYVRPTYQCLQNIILPTAPYLVGILIHRWETPWVKIFPLRLLLRLGAEYRYYPCPIISTRNRESVYVEIGHTIINLLADFRNFSYTLPTVRGLMIHMEERKTTVSIPKNRYDQVMRALNNSSEHILALAGNFSSLADSHLVCIQDTNGTNENAYSTHAINIQNKPRKVTGASFIILNGALKTTSGLTAKSSIIEDGLMIQILPDQMVKLRDSLRNMKSFQINCGCVNSESDEQVNLIWTENDTNFNIGVTSPIDNKPMNGVPSIRVHNGTDHYGSSKFMRWTEVFIIQSGEETVKTRDPIDISKLSESIAKSTCLALVKYLEMLAANSFTKVAIRVSLHSESVSYEAGSNGVKLAPIYMCSLDQELIPVLHNITSNNFGDSPVVLELVFYILNL